MKKLLLISLLVILGLGVASGLFAQATVTIGEGTTVNTTTGSPTPYGTYYKNFHQQYLLRASEIEDAGGGAGNINSIAFNVDNINTISAMPNYTIKLKQTTQTELTTTFEVGTYTTVWTAAEFTPVAGWNTHTFTTPFAWNGSANIIVDIVTTLIPGAYTQNASVFYTPTTYNSALRNQSDTVDAATSLTGTVSLNRCNIRFNMAALVVTNPPNPANLASPANGATLVTLAATLNWLSGGGVPTGYKLSLGTNNPPTNILNYSNLGMVNSYDPPGNLLPATTYYWKVTPFNANGDAPNCPVWSFTTHGDPTVTALPYTQNWDAVTAPAYPFDWTTIVQSTVTYAYVNLVTTNPQSAPNCVSMYNSSDLDAQLLLVGPQIGTSLSVNTIRVKFWAKGSAAYHLLVGVMSNPTDPATFVTVQDVNAIANWNEYTVNLTPYTGAGRYIAFKHASTATYQSIYVDGISYELIAPDDLGATTITGNSTPSVNAVTNYTVGLQNWGTAAQSTYTVKLMSGTTELASVAGPTIAAGAIGSVQIAYTPTVEGPMSIYGKVGLTGDANSGNDQTTPMNITVMPAGIAVVTIGTGDLAEGVPFEFYFKNSLFEALYYPSEIGMFGNITALTFYNNFITDLPNKPIKIWLGSTQLADLSGGWILPDQLTLVYDGTANFPIGTNSITIPLQAPYSYSGGNLVLYANRPMDTAFFSPSDNFLAQTE
ncbi:MAG: choice-of-anchor J domain-containing protein, partial [Candidatus Cloacimonas sp.]|nr:choice-of-anchor J domain-containing protein [Candidatus Cloacimonas sp.]